MDNKTEKEEKTSILLSLLNERYNASHQMRERSYNFAFWILGSAVALIWLLLSEKSLTSSAQWFLTILVALLGLLTCHFIIAIHKGFNRNKEAMVNIEDALGCYDEGVFCKDKRLYPSEYKKEESCWRRFFYSHFTTLYFWIAILYIAVIILIWINPNKDVLASKQDALGNNQQIEIKQDSNSNK